MPNRWIIFVKKWASDNNFSYGCALSKPELKAAYNREYPKINKLPKGVAKLQESKPPADVKSKMTFPNLKIVTQPQEEEQENIQFDVEEMDESAKPKRGRPQKHMTDEEKYKAKLESNKQKRRERAAAKKLKGGMLEPDHNDTQIRKNIKHMGHNIKYIMNLNDPDVRLFEKENENYNSAVNAFDLLKQLKNPDQQEKALMRIGETHGVIPVFVDAVMDLPNHYINNNMV